VQHRPSEVSIALATSAAAWTSNVKSLGIIFLLALAVFAYGLYSDITLTRCARGTITAALGLCSGSD